MTQEWGSPLARLGRDPTTRLSFDRYSGEPDFTVARIRNALPVPADQYGDPGEGGIYEYFDDVDLDPPTDPSPAYADISPKRH